MQFFHKPKSLFPNLRFPFRKKPAFENGISSAASLQNSFRTNPSFLLKPWRWILDLPNDQARTTEFPGFERPEKIELMSFGGPAGKSMVMFLNGPTQTVEISDRV